MGGFHPFHPVAPLHEFPLRCRVARHPRPPPPRPSSSSSSPFLFAALASFSSRTPRGARPVRGASLTHDRSRPRIRPVPRGCSVVRAARVERASPSNRTQRHGRSHALRPRPSWRRGARNTRRPARSLVRVRLTTATGMGMCRPRGTRHSLQPEDWAATAELMQGRGDGWTSSSSSWSLPSLPSSSPAGKLYAFERAREHDERVPHAADSDAGTRTRR